MSVTVETDDGEHHTIRVAPDWHDGSNLLMELNETNLQLLGMKPAERVEDFVPELTEPNVSYAVNKRHLYIQYFQMGAWKTKRHTLRKDFENTDDVQEESSKQARLLQMFFDLHHEPDEAKKAKSKKAAK